MNHALSDQSVAEYLECISKSGVLGKSPRRLALLEYILRVEQRGEGDSLKAYAIGVDVLNRAEDFDPTVDSSVRVEMGRLRTALAVFEASEFNKSDIIVDIPVGGYRPKITARDMTAPVPPTNDHNFWTKTKIMAALAIVVVVGLAAFIVPKFVRDTPSSDFAARVMLEPFVGDPLLASQVELSLRRGLLPNQAIAIVLSTDDRMQDVDFSLHGLASQIGPTKSRIDVELTHIATNRVVWGKSIIVSDNEDVEQRISADIGSELRVRLLGASKELLEERDIEELSAQQLFVVATWVPGRTIKNALDWEEDRIAMMEWSLAREPDLGTTHSVMADKLGHLANIYPRFNTPTVSDAIRMHADRALELAPLNPDVVFNVAQSHWHAGRIAQSHALMSRVLDLDPGNSLAQFYAEVMPYTCAIAPDSVVRSAINFDASLSPDNPIRWITLSWIGALFANSGDYETALDYEQRAAVIFEIPYTFMQRAMLMNKLGRPDAAAELIIRQRENWPDVSPQHFANVTVPRLCGDASLRVFHEQDYGDFAVAMNGRL